MATLNVDNIANSAGTGAPTFTQGLALSATKAVKADKIQDSTGTGILNINTSGTMTLPNSTSTVAGLGIIQTFTETQTITSSAGSSSIVLSDGGFSATVSKTNNQPSIKFDSGGTTDITLGIGAAGILEVRSGDNGPTIIGTATQAGLWTFGTTTLDSRHLIQAAPTTSNGAVLNVYNQSTAAGSNDNACLDLFKGLNSNTTSDVYVRFRYNADAAGTGAITGDGGTSVQFTSVSDERLKQNIVDYSSTDALNKIASLRPRQFEMKDNPGNIITGFIAQEVQPVYPKNVGQQEDGYLTLGGMGGMIPELVGAIKALKTKLDTLQSDYDSYKAAHP